MAKWIKFRSGNGYETIAINAKHLKEIIAIDNNTTYYIRFYWITNDITNDKEFRQEVFYDKEERDKVFNEIMYAIDAKAISGGVPR